MWLGEAATGAPRGLFKAVRGDLVLWFLPSAYSYRGNKDMRKFNHNKFLLFVDSANLNRASFRQEFIKRCIALDFNVPGDTTLRNWFDGISIPDTDSLTVLCNMFDKRPIEFYELDCRGVKTNA